MGAKIVLTGTRVSKVRKTEEYYAFEMREGGSPTAPKGMPLSSEIEYTVFVGLKMGKKAGLDSSPRDQRWMIKGELVVDIPVDQCPGEIGVITFGIEPLVPKDKTEKAESTAEQDDQVKEPPQQYVAEVAAAAAPQLKKKPSEPVTVPIAVTLTDDVIMLPIEELEVPEDFLRTRPNPMKTKPLRELVKRTGKIDKPIEARFDGQKYVLVDGYRRYIVAKEAGFKELPIIIKKEGAENE